MPLGEDDIRMTHMGLSFMHRLDSLCLSLSLFSGCQHYLHVHVHTCTHVLRLAICRLSYVYLSKNNILSVSTVHRDQVGGKPPDISTSHLAGPVCLLLDQLSISSFLFSSLHFSSLLLKGDKLAPYIRSILPKWIDMIGQASN